MAPKRKAVAETVVSPVKKAAATRKRKVADAVVLPDDEETAKEEGNKTRNTRNYHNLGDIAQLIRMDTFGDVNAYIQEKELAQGSKSTTRASRVKKESNSSSSSNIRNSKNDVNEVKRVYAQNAPRVSPEKTGETNRTTSKSSLQVNLSEEKVVTVTTPADSKETYTSMYSDLISTWDILLDPIYYSVLGFTILVIIFGIDSFLQSGDCRIFPKYNSINDYVESLGLILTLLIILTVGLFLAVVGPFKLAAKLVSKALKIDQINANIMLLFTILAFISRYYAVVAPTLKK